MEILDKIAEFCKLFQKQHDPSVFDTSLKCEIQSSHCKLMQIGSYSHKKSLSRKLTAEAGGSNLCGI